MTGDQSFPTTHAVKGFDIAAKLRANEPLTERERELAARAIHAVLTSRYDEGAPIPFICGVIGSEDDPEGYLICRCFGSDDTRPFYRATHSDPGSPVILPQSNEEAVVP